jgi:hypothetical protein
MTMEKRSVKGASVLRTPPVDLQHLHFAITTADFGSFRRSAEMLSIRQSMLSRSVRQLEDYLGVVLFERSSGGVNRPGIGPSHSGDDPQALARRQSCAGPIGRWLGSERGPVSSSQIVIGRRLRRACDKAISRDERRLPDLRWPSQRMHSKLPTSRRSVTCSVRS